MQSLILKKNGGYDTCIIDRNADLYNLTENDIKSKSKLINFDYLGKWKINSIKLLLYGYKNGKAGDENKHELPPPYDKELYFKNLIIVKYENSEICPLTEIQWLKYYEKLYGGFETLVSEEESFDDSDELTDDSFIVNTDANISVDDSFSSEDEAEFTSSDLETDDLSSDLETDDITDSKNECRSRED